MNPEKKAELAKLYDYLSEKFANFRAKALKHPIYEIGYRKASFVNRAKLEAFSEQELSGEFVMMLLVRALKTEAIVAKVELFEEQDKQPLITFHINDEKWDVLNKDHDNILTPEDKVLVNRYIALFMNIYTQIISLVPPPPQKDQEGKEECCTLSSSD